MSYSKVSGDADDITLMQFGTAVGQLRFRGTSLLLRLPASPVGKSQHQNNKKVEQVNKPQNMPEAVPSKKQKQEEPDDDDDDDDDGDDDDDIDYFDVDDVDDHGGGADMEVDPVHRADDPVPGGIDVASDSDFGSDSSNHGYSIATHFVKVQSSGILADVKSLWQLAGTDAVSQSVKTLLEHTKPGVQRFSSIHAFEKVIGLALYKCALLSNLFSFI